MKNTNEQLQVIIEKHLLLIQDPDLDQASWVNQVVQEYLLCLRKSRLAIPLALEHMVADEIGRIVRESLIRRVAGLSPHVAEDCFKTKKKSTRAGQPRGPRPTSKKPTEARRTQKQ